MSEKHLANYILPNSSVIHDIPGYSILKMGGGNFFYK